MYLTDTLHLDKKYIAVVPLVVYVSSFIAAIACRPISSKVNYKVVLEGFKTVVAFQSIKCSINPVKEITTKRLLRPFRAHKVTWSDKSVSNLIK